MPIFIRPWWLLALIPILIIIIYLYQRKKNAHELARFCDPVLLKKLLIEKGRNSLLPFCLLGIAWSISVISLSGPSWTKIETPVFKSTSTTILLLDLSDEMLVEDPSPSRLSRAKFKIKDVLEQNKERRFALAVFSSEPFTVSPVSNDGDTILSLASALDTDLLPVGGKNIAQALFHAKNLLVQSGNRTGDILLVTTGMASKEDIKAAAKIQKQGIGISVLGVGSKAGGPIPSKNGFVKDNNNQVILSKIEDSSLSDLAQAGGGSYIKFTSSNKDIEALKSTWAISAAKQDDDLSVVTHYDDGYWLLYLLIPLLSLAFMRGFREKIV